MRIAPEGANDPPSDAPRATSAVHPPAVSDGWADVKLPSVQRQKLNHLLERGGRVRSAKILVETPNGSCTIDDFGHVEWLPKVLDAAQPLPHTTPNDKATQHQTP